MVNGKWTAFIKRLYPKRFTIDASHSPIHTPTAIGCHARYQPARQEQLGVRCLAQGHFDTPRVGSNRQPSDCQTTALTSWAISPQNSHQFLQFPSQILYCPWVQMKQKCHYLSFLTTPTPNPCTCNLMNTNLLWNIHWCHLNPSHSTPIPGYIFIWSRLRVSFQSLGQESRGME